MPKNPSKNNYVKIAEASKLLGVHKDTLRRWENAGKIQVIRTDGNTRLYDISNLLKLAPSVKPDISQAPLNNPIPTGELLETTIRPDYTPASNINFDIPEINRPNISEHHIAIYKNLRLFGGFCLILLIAIIGISIFLKSYSGSKKQITTSVTKENNILGASATQPVIKINADAQIKGALSVSGGVNGLKISATGENAGFNVEGNNAGLNIKNNITLDQDLSTGSSPTFEGLTVKSPINAPKTSAETMTVTSSVDQITFDISGTKNIFSWSPTAARKITLPDITDTLVGKTTTDTLTNKTIKSSDTNTISGSFPDITGITSLGTVSTGTWNGSKITTGYGGTGLTSYTTGDLIYSSNTNTLSNLAIGTDGQVLKITSGVPVWGSASLSLSGSDATGTLTVGKGGTAITTYSTGDLLYGSATDTLSKLSIGSSGQVLGISSGAPAWTTLSYESPLTFGSAFSRSSNAISLSSSVGIGVSYANAALPSNGLAIQGNLGIGTTSPAAALDVVGNANVSGTLTVSGSLVSTGSQSGYFQRNSGNISPITITDNIGIGTSNPSTSLQVTGNALINPQTDTTALTLRASPSGTANILNITDSTGNTSYFSINSSGQLSGSALKITDVNNAIVGTAIPGGWSNVNLHEDSTNYSFTYRRQVTVNNNSGSTLPANYEITIDTTSLTAANASQIYSNVYQTSSPYKDFRLAYYDGTNYNEIPTAISSFTSSNITLKFQIQSAIAGTSDTNYYLFYSNSSYSSLPTPWTYTSGNTQIDALDNIGVGTTNWTSSDSTQFNLEIGTSAPAQYEGSGSFKLTGTVDNIGTFATTSQGQLAAARTNFGFASPTISGTRYLYAVGGSTDGTAANGQATVYRTSVNSTAGNVGTWTTNANSLSAGVIDNTVVAAAPPIDGGTGSDGSIDLSLGSGAGGCTGTGLSWSGSTCTIATATKSTFNFTTISIPFGTTLTTNGPKSTTNFVTVKATGNVTIGGTINLAEKGYTSANGPAKGSDSTGSIQTNGGGGGGHGGAGGRGGGTTYGAGGSAYNATDDSGSGGGTNRSDSGGAGGGGIKISSSGTVTVSGTINANGASAQTSQSNAGSGGGAGGRIALTGTSVTVSGTLSANGGNGGGCGNFGSGGGGGGGGRITLQYTSSVTTTGSTITVTKGSANDSYCGGVADGSIGTSTSSGLSPYLYILGGKNTSDAAQSAINYAAITSSDGSVGAFSSSATALPQALFGHASLVLTISSTNYLYVLGGNNDTSDQTTVYKGTFNSDGSIAAIATTSQTQLGTGISYPALANVSISSTNYLYVIGGLNGSTAQTSVYKGTVDASGDITALTTTSQGTLPVALYGASAYVATVGSTNYLYVIGGKTTGGTRQTVVYRATIDASGNVGTFTTDAQTQLTTATSNQASFNFTDDSSNQYAYMIGGNTAASSALTSVTKAIYTPIDQTTYNIARTNFSPTDLSKYNDLTFWVNSTLTGTYLTAYVTDTSGGVQQCSFSGSANFTISSANTWEQKTCSMTSMTRAQVTGIKFSVATSQSSPWTASFDDIQAERNHTTISNSLSAGSSVLGAASLAVNAQGTGLLQINYSNPNASPATAQAGSGGMAVYNGAATALFSVDSTGNVGIGLSNAQSKLVVSGNLNVGFTGAVSDPLGLSVRGNVGIGTTSPTAPLYVWGNGRNSGLFLNGNIGIGTTIPSQLFQINNSGSSAFVVTSNGNVGIGITTPSTNLGIGGNMSIGSLYGWKAAPTNGLAIQGNLGIGTTTANSNLSIAGNAHIGGQYQGISGPANGLFVDGNVGIGATTSSNKLDVWGNTKLTGTLTVNSAAIFNGNLGIGFTSPSQNLTVYDNDAKIETFLVRATNGATGWNSANATLFIGKDATTGRSINAAGTINQSGADYAEYFYQETPGDLQKGDLVCISKEGKAAKCTNSSKLLGVVSTNPGTVGNDIYDQNHPELTAIVGLMGQIPTKVSTESGVIKTGDYLTSSSVPDVAMKAIRPGQVIGKALEDYNETGKIMAFVSVSYADPGNFLASLSMDSDGNLIMPKVKVGKLSIDPSIATSSGQLTTTSSSVILSATKDINTSYSSSSVRSYKSEYDLGDKLASLEDRIKALESEIATPRLGEARNDIAGVATSSALAEATNSASPSANLASNSTLNPIPSTLNLTPPDTLLASGSAILTDLSVKSDATISGQLTAYDFKASNSFKSLGDTTLANTRIAGILTVDGTLSIDNGSELNVVGTLYLQKSPLAQGVDIFDGKVTIDKTGKLTASQIQTEKLILGPAILGESKIASGSAEAVIQTPALTEKSKVFVTSQVDIDNPLFVTEKIIGQSFKVKTRTPAAGDIIFDWQVLDSP